MGLKPGSPIPEFTLPDQEGTMFSSKETIGKHPLVLFFYPRDYTPGCTREVCAFRDKYEDFLELGVEVIGISSDSEKTHRNFARSYNLPFRLLADKEKKARTLFNIESRFFNLLPGRETFIFDSTGTLRMSFSDMDPAQHINKALKAIKEQEIK